MSLYMNITNESLCDSVLENSTNEPNQEFEKIINGLQGYIIWGIVFEAIAILGFIGNFSIILVLKYEPISSLTIMLIALAVSDMLAPLSNALISFSFYHLSNKYSNSVSFLIFNDILRHIVQPLSTMFTMSSSWIVTTATLFRLIAVVLPIRARTLLNKRYTYLSLFIIFGMSLLSIIPLYASLSKKLKCTKEDQQIVIYEAFDMQVNSEAMAKFYLPTIQSLSFYFPWLISLILWLLLLRSLRKSDNNFQHKKIKYTSSKRSSNYRPSISNNDTMMLDKNLINDGKYKNVNLTKSESTNSNLLINNSVRNRSKMTKFDQSNSFNRTSSYNKVTLMVVVLCFTNLICRLFTFVFLFEVIYNEYVKKNYKHSKMENSNFVDVDEDLNAKTEFPKFMAYSLLLNNIFLCINHSCNILIYTFTNPRFKKNLKRLLKNFYSCNFFKKT